MCIRGMAPLMAVLISFNTLTLSSGLMLGWQTVTSVVALMGVMSFRGQAFLVAWCSGAQTRQTLQEATVILNPSLKASALHTSVVEAALPTKTFPSHRQSGQ